MMQAEWDDRNVGGAEGWILRVGGVECATVLAVYGRSEWDGREYVKGWHWVLGESEFPWWDERDGKTEGTLERRDDAMQAAEAAVAARLRAATAAIEKGVVVS